MMRATRRRIVVVAALALVVAGGGAAAHVVSVITAARGDLSAAGEAADRASAAFAAGDLEAAKSAVAEMSDRAAAVDLDGDPVWALAERVPYLGGNLTAVRVAASGLARLGTEVATPLLTLTDDLRDADLASAVPILRDAAPQLQAADRVREEVQKELRGLDRGALIGPVVSGLESLDGAVATAAPLTTSAAQISELLPAILGADEKRTVLVMVQNTAELRTGGGITGTFLQLNVDGGRMALAELRDSTGFPVMADPLLPLHPEEVRAYGDGIGRFVQNASMTADFTLTARLASAWWANATSVTPDAVVSVDPMVLAAVLRVVGPIDLGTGALGADDVVDRLLVQPYLSLSPEEQSAWFTEVAGGVFAAVVDRGGPVQLAVALQEPVAQGRVAVWSARPAEQSLLEDTVLGGPLARQRQAGDHGFAVYFNDATGGKLTPYLGVGLGVGTAVCRADGRADVVVSVALNNALDPTAVTSLPLSVTGGGIWGVAVGDIAPTVTVVAPPGWFLGGSAVDGQLAAAVEERGDEQSSVTRRTDLAPGATRILTFRFISPDTGAVDPVLFHTPLLSEPGSVEAAEVCAGIS
jgi:hypothetical protein